MTLAITIAKPPRKSDDKIISPHTQLNINTFLYFMKFLTESRMFYLPYFTRTSNMFTLCCHKKEKPIKHDGIFIAFQSFRDTNSHGVYH